MIEEVTRIICKDCLVSSVCDDACDQYWDVFDPIYKEMKILEEKIGRKLHPSEVKHLSMKNAKRIKDDESAEF